MIIFKNATKEYLEYLQSRNKSKMTVNGYNKCYDYFSNFMEKRYNGPFFIDEITFEDIESYQNYLLNVRGLKPQSVNLYTTSIRSLLTYSFKKAWVTKNVALDVENIDCEKKERVYLSPQEIDCLLNAVKTDVVYEAIATMVYTGMRISEITELKMDAVDLDVKMIRVLGKGKKERILPISEKLHSILVHYLDNIRDSDSNYFFATNKSGRLSQAYINSGIKDAAYEAGITALVSAHNLRHSFATNLIHNNVNIVEVKSLLGHASIKTTGIYLHCDKKKLIEAVNSL